MIKSYFVKICVCVCVWIGLYDQENMDWKMLCCCKCVLEFCIGEMESVTCKNYILYLHYITRTFQKQWCKLYYYFSVILLETVTKGEGEREIFICSFHAQVVAVVWPDWNQEPRILSPEWQRLEPSSTALPRCIGRELDWKRSSHILNRVFKLESTWRTQIMYICTHLL